MIKKRKSVPDQKVEATEHSHAEDVKGGRHPLLHGQHQDIYQFVKTNDRCTREDISIATGIKSSTATARVKELIDEGFVLEVPGMRKENRSGVRAKVLTISERATGGNVLDKVRIEVVLTIDCNGVYGAIANVVKGKRQASQAFVIAKKRITLTAPHSDTYKSRSSTEKVAHVSRHEAQAHAEDIVDADYVVISD